MSSEGSHKDRPGRGIVLFAQGLRPFFLLAGLDAILNMLVWLTVWFYPGSWPELAYIAMYWHGHEMLFGFVSAAIGGFLLTAVPGWTGRPSYAGAPLMLMTVLWLLGRVAMFPWTHAPAIAAAILDLGFFPALALVLAPPLIRARKLRNLPFLVLLSALFAADLVFHLGRIGVVPDGELTGLGIAVDVVLILVTVVGGRIVPAFTKSGLARRGLESGIVVREWLDRAAIASMIGVLAGDLVAAGSPANGVLAGIAALLQCARWLQWKGMRTLREPLLWVLHLGYGWLVAGLALKSAWLVLHADFAAKWLHAFTAGVFATMILAVMTRASLGHTGRALAAPRPMTISYLLVTLAAAVRVFGPSIAGERYDITIAVAGMCWLVAFALFVAVHGPILTLPRADGRPG